MSVSSRLASLVLAVALLAGCSEGATLPVSVAGSYTLSAAAGQPLPATVVDGDVADPAGGFHLRIHATDGTLALTADGRYQQRVQHSTYVNGQLSGHVLRADHGTYTVAADSIRFTSDYLQNVQFSAARDGHTLTVLQDATGEGVPVAYRFVR